MVTRIEFRSRVESGSRLAIGKSHAQVSTMWNTICYKVTQTLGAISSMNLTREHWIAISIVMLGLGFFFMRGFGSRTGY
jgi:hypothetical protein